MHQIWKIGFRGIVSHRRRDILQVFHNVLQYVTPRCIVVIVVIIVIVAVIVIRVVPSIVGGHRMIVFALDNSSIYKRAKNEISRAGTVKRELVEGS